MARKNDFAQGYQDALVDIVHALCEKSEAGVIEWLRNNLSAGYDRDNALEALEDYQRAK